MVTAVVTALPLTEAVVAIDALAIVPGAKAEEGVVYKELLTRPGQQASLAQAAVLPAGPKVYVSGQYVKGNFEEATQRTIESLESRFVFSGWAGEMSFSSRHSSIPCLGLMRLGKSSPRTSRVRQFRPCVLLSGARAFLLKSNS